MVFQWQLITIHPQVMIINGAEIKMDSLICFALKEEAAPFRKIAAGKSLRSSARE